MPSAAPLAHLRWGAVGATAGCAPVILLHGIGGGADAWGDAHARTGRAIADAGFDVLAPDLPGYGGSAVVEPPSMASMARAVLELSSWAGADTCIVLGHSMGGMVAQEMTALAPRRIAGLVLSATSAAFGKPEGAWQERFLRERLKPLDEGQGMAALACTLVKAMCAPGAGEIALDVASKLMARVPEATYRQALKALMGFDRREGLPLIGVPVLALAGEVDPNAPQAVMQAMAARIPTAEYQCLPGVGHLANIEAPDLFNAAVVAFLRSHFIDLPST